MELQLNWVGVSVIITIVLHASLLIRGWTILEMKLSQVTRSFTDLNRGLEERDKQIAALWKRMDNLGERMIKMETTCVNNHGD